MSFKYIAKLHVVKTQVKSTFQNLHCRCLGQISTRHKYRNTGRIPSFLRFLRFLRNNLGVEIFRYGWLDETEDPLRQEGVAARYFSCAPRNRI